ncbi:hypothetical protein CANCADRAFT_42625 [Tortispora caseinolytica NRRL Y-17796]|uniref:C2 domain-containing protein n=1 Tax=Tortispora caseinolytica NRRL Y-17796 TaxID=767744 RepID=A0A1E4TJR6_9ASCO|nr:hypothetical protein CANCADRAFT_42625 [Tortispora caseinolytica NRRL Y-17796]
MDEPISLGTLVVVIMHGKHLNNVRSLGKQSPYCVARVANIAHNTPVDTNAGQTPRWNHEMRFNIQATVDHRSLKLSVFDQQSSKIVLIGDADIDLEPAFASNPKVGYDGHHKIFNRSRYAGDIFIEMTYYKAKPTVPQRIPHSPSASILNHTIKNTSPSSSPLPAVSRSSFESLRPLPSLPPTTLRTHSRSPSSSRLFPTTSSERPISFPELQRPRSPIRTDRPPSPLHGPRPPSTFQMPPLPSELEISPNASMSASPSSAKSTVKRKPVGAGVDTYAASETSVSGDSGKAAATNNNPTVYIPYSADSLGNIKLPKPVSNPDKFTEIAPMPSDLFGYQPKGHDDLVDPGTGGYQGNQTWSSTDGRTSHSTSPRRPPKIPLGMKPEEYFESEIRPSYGKIDL